jgi:PAS domain S-box-containing protein
LETQRQTEEALHASEDRLRLFVDDLPAPCVIYDAERRFKFVNRSTVELMRRPAAEIIGRRDEELLPPAITDVYLPHLRRAIETRSPQEAECWFPGGNGGFYYIAHYVPCLDAHGRVSEVLGISYNITREKRVEAKLRRQEQDFRSLAETVPDIIARIDCEGRHLYVNRGIEALTGMPADLFLGKTDRELGMPPDLVFEWDQIREQLLLTRQPVVKEFACRSPAGLRHFETRQIPEFDAEGGVETILTITRDVTDQKRALTRLAESEERFRTAFESAPLGMFIVNADASVRKANQAFCDMLGYTDEEMRRLSNFDVTHPDDVAAGRELVARLASGEIPLYTREKRYVAKNGQIVWARLTGATVRDERGEPAYYMGMVENITERHCAQAELERYREHLEELVRSRTRALEASQESLRSAERLASLGTLAAGIAHEINNPVGTILLAAEMALAAQESGDRERLTHCLETITQDAQRCGRIIKNVLSFARQEPSEKSLCDLNGVVRRAVERTEAHASRRGVILEQDLDARVGSLMMNSMAIEQALTNILHNAVESGPGGVIIRVSTAVSGPCYRVIIADDGPGIPAELQPYIFDPFFTMRRQGGGTGLGLSLVHGTISDHRGRIHVKSAEGAGTTFTIELPWDPRPAENLLSRHPPAADMNA